MSASEKNQELLKIVVVGHVDHGKSTLIGRLFHDTGSLPDGKFEAIQDMCKKRGMPFEWAFLLDAMQAERDQGITIDTTQIWFNTAKRDYVIIDAPSVSNYEAEVQILSELCDFVLLVVPSGQITESVLNAHIERIGKENLAGVVFNER